MCITVMPRPMPELLKLGWMAVNGVAGESGVHLYIRPEQDYIPATAGR